jgi:hypothetical protein
LSLGRLRIFVRSRNFDIHVSTVRSFEESLHTRF